MLAFRGEISIALLSVALTACGGNVDTEAPALSGVSAIAAGAYDNCALLEDGGLRCWGADSGIAGESAAGSWRAVAVPGIPSAVSVSVGVTHACAVPPDGSVACWGKMPAQSWDEPAPATPVEGVTDARTVVAGIDHSCALRADGTVQCWGKPHSIGLSDPLQSSFHELVSVSDLSDATALAIYSSSTCALLSGGQVKCWGSIWYEEKDATSKEAAVRYGRVSTPTLVDGLTNATSISSGLQFSCALLADATVACWGTHAGDSLLDRENRRVSATPVAIPDLTSVTAISAASAHVCALLADGTVHCWGNNLSGQLGDGSFTSSSLPARVKGIDSAIAIAAGEASTCALLADRTVRCWGRWTRGCAGGTCDSSVPVIVRVAP